MSETAAKKDIQKLQRAIVDGLEDVKAQDIRVYNTEHLTPLFERVIVASGTSSRQTKALASSVRDKVRESSFAKPRIEGEENGEWIIVDCGSAVVHIMQPAIRQYYSLEEIWGDKPVRLKGPASKKAAAAAARQAGKADKAAREAKQVQARSAATPAPAAKKTKAVAPVKAAAKSAAKTTAKTSARTTARATTAPKASPARKTPAGAKAAFARKTPARGASTSARKTATRSTSMQTVVVNKPAVKRGAAKKAG